MDDPFTNPEQIACRDVTTRLFYPEGRESPDPALAWCHGCTIRRDCLAWALQRGEVYGVWGGTTEGQRRKMLGKVRIRHREQVAA